MEDGARARLPDGWQAPSDYLRERVVLVAGAAGGLGRASALACARAGARTILLGRRVARLEKLYDEICAIDAGAPALYPMDLAGASPRDHAELAATIGREYGRLDGLVHAAAHFSGLQPMLDCPPDDWLRAMHVNVTAPFLLTQACASLMHEAADPAVVFVLDDAQRTTRAYWGGYGVAKGAQQAMVSILREESATSGLRVHALLPAPMRTALRHMAYYGEDANGVATADAAGAAVAYLLGTQGAAARGAVLDLR